MTDPTSTSDGFSAPSTTSGAPDPRIPTEHGILPSAAAQDPWNARAQTMPIDEDATAPTPAAAAPLGTVPINPAPIGTAPTVPTAAVGGPPPIELGAMGVGGLPAPRHRGRAAAIVTGIVVLLLLVGVGAYAALRTVAAAGGTAEPESAMPASVATFVRVDLTPGGADRLALNTLLQRFQKSGGDPVTNLETSAATAAGLDYATDVKGWFGGRVGTARWVDKAGANVGLLALASRDDTAARTALGKATGHGTDFGYVVSGGWALVAYGAPAGTAQSDAADAAAAAKHASLRASGAFTSATGHVGGSGSLLLGYADLHVIAPLLQKQLSAANGLGKLLGPAGAPAATGLPLIPGLDPSRLTGTIAFGGRIAGGNLEFRYHASGLPAATGGADVRPLLDALPGGTLVGIATDGFAAGSPAASAVSSMLGKLVTNQLAGAGPLANGGVLGDAIRQALLTGLTDTMTKVLTAKGIALGVTSLAPGTPGLSLNVEARTSTDASSIFSLLKSLTLLAPQLQVSQAGDTIHATYGTSAASGGTLGDDPLFRTATAGMSQAQAATYVNVTRLVAAASASSLDAATRARLAPLQAIAIQATASGTTADGLIRIVVTK